MTWFYILGIWSILGFSFAFLVTMRLTDEPSTPVTLLLIFIHGPLFWLLLLGILLTDFYDSIRYLSFTEWYDKFQLIRKLAPLFIKKEYLPGYQPPNVETAMRVMNVKIQEEHKRAIKVRT